MIPPYIQPPPMVSARECGSRIGRLSHQQPHTLPFTWPVGAILLTQEGTLMTTTMAIASSVLLLAQLAGQTLPAL